MNAISTVTYINDAAEAAHNAARATAGTMGLGPNQLKWLRRHMSAFKQLEEQRYMLWQDSVRAARMAGLI
jgi:hypothetical protein